MRFKILLIIFFLSLNFNLYANELVEESKIHKNLRCLVCQGQSIADSNSDFALTLKMVVKDLIGEFKSRPKKSKGSVNKRYHGNRSWIKSQEAVAR